MSETHKRILDMKNALIEASNQGVRISPELEFLLNDYAYVILAYVAAREVVGELIMSQGLLTTTPSEEVAFEEADDKIQDKMIELRNKQRGV